MLRRKGRKQGKAVPLPEEKLSELVLARRKLEQAQARFDSATDISFDYANSELTAALEYLGFVTNKGRRLVEQGRCGAWGSV